MISLCCIDASRLLITCEAWSKASRLLQSCMRFLEQDSSSTWLIFNTPLWSSIMFWIRIDVAHFAKLTSLSVLVSKKLRELEIFRFESWYRILICLFENEPYHSLQSWCMLGCPHKLELLLVASNQDFWANASSKLITEYNGIEQHTRFHQYIE